MAVCSRSGHCQSLRLVVVSGVGGRLGVVDNTLWMLCPWVICSFSVVVVGLHLLA